MEGGEPLTHGRDFAEFLDRYEIKAGDRSEYVKILQGLQPTVVVDDVRHLVTPLAVPSGHYYLYHTPTVGWRAAWTFRSAGSRGFYVTWLRHTAANIRLAMSNAPGSNMPPVVAVAGNSAPGVVPSELPPTSVFNEYGDVALVVTPGVDLGPSNQAYAGCPFYVAPGVTLMITNTSVTNVLSCGLGIQEIP